MSLFVCDECGCIENTALTNWYGYHGRNIVPVDAEGYTPTILPKVLPELGDGLVRCSECISGTWHGRWPKRRYDPERDKDSVVNR
jgi:hypothetical protein